MSLLGRLALLFIVVPLIELILLVELGRRIGLLPTLALVIVTGITGATMARLEGRRVFFQFQIEMGSGRLPGQAMLDGVSVLIGGAFLLTPGIFTDLVGFALLFPFSRRWLQRYAKAWMKKKVTDGTIHVGTMSQGGIHGWRGDEYQDPGPGTSSELDPTKGIVIEPDKKQGK